MNQKIEWYREVLDLEPGSRVFFPLARLLVAEGDAAQAIKTLQLGISRHPDHIEARLLLVEVLAANAREHDLRSELASLGELFRSYPEFWKIWSRHLAETPAMQDAALALSFFAAALNGSQITWASVIAHGLHTLLNGGAEASPPVAIKGEPDSGNEPDPEGEPDSEGWDEPVLEASMGDGEGTDSEKRLLSAEASHLAARAAGVTISPLLAGVELPEDIFAGDAVAGFGMEGGTSSVHEPKPEDFLSIPLAGAAEIGRMDVFIADAPAQQAEDDEAEEGDEPEEPFSLRTRSMAEVLSAQGDIAGALEIYHELLLSASGDEKLELVARIEELSTPGGAASAHSPVREEEPREESNRLVSLLESLAQRLEDRAR